MLGDNRPVTSAAINNSQSQTHSQPQSQDPIEHFMPASKRAQVEQVLRIERNQKEKGVSLVNQIGN